MAKNSTNTQAPFTVPLAEITLAENVRDDNRPLANLAGAVAAGENVRGANLGDVKGLAASIAKVGLLNPLTVRAGDSGGWTLVAGYRRFAALQALGAEYAPVTVWDPADHPDAHHLAAQLVENLQREDLTPVAEARGLAQLVEIAGGQRQAAAVVGRSAGHVSKRLALLQLPEPVQVAVDAGEIPPADAYDLARVKDAKNQRRLAARFLEDTAAGQGLRFVRHEVARTIQTEAEDAQLRNTARKLNRERGDDGPPIVSAADVGAGKAGRWLDGWDGLPVDYDAHLAEHCHRRVLMALDKDGQPSTWRDLCLEPNRHTANGESPVRLIMEDSKAADQRRRSEVAAAVAKSDAKRRLAEAARRDAAAAAVKVLTRATALDVLTEAALADLDLFFPDDELSAFFAELVGVNFTAGDCAGHESTEGPAGVATYCDGSCESGEPESVDDWLARLTGAKRWRAAAGVALWHNAVRPINDATAAEAVLTAAGYVAPDTDTEDTTP